MKRSLRLLLLVAIAVGFLGLTQAWAQGYKSKNDENLRFYVFWEKRGLEVTCSKMTNMVEINERSDAIDKENVGIGQANAVLIKEITDLKKKLPALQAKTSKSSKLEQADKDAAQVQIDQIEADIKSKQAQMKPTVKYGHSRAYNKSADADKFIADVQAQAAAEKAAAERAAAAKEKAAAAKTK